MRIQGQNLSSGLSRVRAALLPGLHRHAVLPRDPNPQGIYKGKFWARVFLVLMLFGLALGILASFHII